MAIQIDGFDHVTFMITDVERARRFYGGLLGLEELTRPPTFNFPGAWFRVGALQLHLVGQEKPDAASRRHACFWTKDVHGVHRELLTAGYEGKWDARKIAGVDRFFIYDPDGNRVEFQGPEAPSANA